MAVFIRCPACRGQYDVTGCPPGSRFLCQQCGKPITVAVTDSVPASTAVPCPACGRETPAPDGEARRCRYCGSPLGQPPPGPLRGEELVGCPRCGTRYDVSRYGPGTRFRCRRCGVEVRIPLRGRWLGAGEWELDPDTGSLRCNGCGEVYDVSGRTADAAFVCRRCRRVFVLPPVLPVAEKMHGTAGDEWEMDVSAGLIRCHGCGFSYDFSLYAGETDFTCPRCRAVFRMPMMIGSDTATRPPEAEREIILCNKCGAIHDVSDYPRGTIFSCDTCGTVLKVSGIPGEWEVDAEGGVLVCSACGFHLDIEEAADKGPSLSCPRCQNPFRLAAEAAFARAAAPAATGLAEAPRPEPVEGPRPEPVEGPEPLPPVEEGKPEPGRVLRCGSCGARYDVAGRTPGHRFRCRTCKGVLTVPGAPGAAAPAEAPPAKPSRPPTAAELAGLAPPGGGPGPAGEGGEPLPQSVREGKAILLECKTCRVAYEVPLALAAGRLRCRTCRSPVTPVARGGPLGSPGPTASQRALASGHEVQILQTGRKKPASGKKGPAR
ncbi:MAG: hypothetical protein L0216_13560 [Planctomycetales bacterium]|nr:hypothetical protein [Planctomycetales bacterium]